ncbi:MAG: ribose 5-phosphate isomerase B [Eubacterium sp.]
MKIGFGCDHAAIDLKNELIRYMTEKGYECIDFGTNYNEKGEIIKCDYPAKGREVGEAVANGKVEYGVLICGTGIGISVAANKVPGVRAAVCSEPYSAKLTKQHNDANIIAFGARVVGTELAKMILDEFFGTEFEGGRHQRRVDMISDIEKYYCKTF